MVCGKASGPIAVNRPRLCDRKLFPLIGLRYFNDTRTASGATPFGLPSVVNGGDARIYGVDPGLNSRTPLTGLTLQAVAKFNSSTLQNINPQLTVVSPTARNGSQRPGVSKYNYSVGAIYSTAITTP